MNIGNSGTWYGMEQATSGSGSISVTGNIATVSGSTSPDKAPDKALLNKRMFVEAGETITVSILARQTVGAENGAKLAISYPTMSTPRAFATISGKSLKKYSVTLTIPYAHSNVTDIFNIIVGNFEENEGTVEILDFIIESSGSTLPAARVAGMGMITVASGVPIIDVDYRSQGITGITFDAGNIYIQTDWVYKPDLEFIPLVSITHDQGLYRNLVITGNMDRFGLGRVYVTFSDPVTGIAVDPTTAEGIRFSFVVMT